MERKIAINAGVGCGIPISEVIPMVKAAGFDGIFTSWDEDRPNEEWANIIAREGLIYQSIHSPFDHIEYLWEEEEAGETYTDKLIRCVEHCERFDVPVMVVHPIKGMDRHSPCERGIRRFARLVEAAEKTRVKLAFENVENREYLDMIMERLGGSDSVGSTMRVLATGNDIVGPWKPKSINRLAMSVASTPYFLNGRQSRMNSCPTVPFLPVYTMR